MADPNDVDAMLDEMNGGPAFPCADDEATYEQPNRGMSLRDYFAAKAMQGYCSDREWRADCDADATARSAYFIADAMLKARQS